MARVRQRVQQGRVHAGHRKGGGRQQGSRYRQSLPTRAPSRGQTPPSPPDLAGSAPPAHAQRTPHALPILPSLAPPALAVLMLLAPPPFPALASESSPEQLLAESLVDHFDSLPRSDRIAFFERLIRASSPPSSSSEPTRLQRSLPSWMLPRFLDSSEPRSSPSCSQSSSSDTQLLPNQPDPADESERSLSSTTSANKPDTNGQQETQNLSEEKLSTDDASAQPLSEDESIPSPSPDDESADAELKQSSQTLSIFDMIRTSDVSQLLDQARQYASTRNGRLSIGIGLSAGAGLSSLFATVPSQGNANDEPTQLVRQSSPRSDDDSGRLVAGEPLGDGDERKVLWRRENPSADEESAMSQNMSGKDLYDDGIDYDDSRSEDKNDDLFACDIEENLEELRARR